MRPFRTNDFRACLILREGGRGDGMGIRIEMGDFHSKRLVGKSLILDNLISRKSKPYPTQVSELSILISVLDINQTSKVNMIIRIFISIIPILILVENQTYPWCLLLACYPKKPCWKKSLGVD